MLHEWKNPEIAVSVCIIGLLGETGAASVSDIAKLVATDTLDEVLLELEDRGYVRTISVDKMRIVDPTVYTLRERGREMYHAMTELNAVEVVDQINVKHALDALDIGIRVQSALGNNAEWYATSEARGIINVLSDTIIEKPKQDNGIPKFSKPPLPDGLIFGEKWTVWVQALPLLIRAPGIARIAARYDAVLERVGGFHQVVWIAQNSVQARHTRIGVGRIDVKDTLRLRLDNVYTLGNEVGHIVSIAKDPQSAVKETPLDQDFRMLFNDN